MARDFKDFEKDLNRLAKKMTNEMPELLDEIGMSGEELFTDNFRREGFLDEGIEKWKPRKLLDQSARSRIRYRTNRVGKVGTLNKYGRSIKGRSLLVKTGKLRGSIRYKKSGRTTIIFSSKDYGRYHNEGIEDRLPKRQFIGRSRTLERIIDKILDKQMKTWLDQ